MRELTTLELNTVSGGWNMPSIGTAINVMSTLATHSVTRYVVGNAGGNMAIYGVTGHLSGNGTTAAGYAGAAVGGLVGGATQSRTLSVVGGQLTGSAAEGILNGRGALAHYFTRTQRIDDALAAAGA